MVSHSEAKIKGKKKGLAHTISQMYKSRILLRIRLLPCCGIYICKSGILIRKAFFMLWHWHWWHYIVKNVKLNPRRHGKYFNQYTCQCESKNTSNASLNAHHFADICLEISLWVYMSRNFLLQIIPRSRQQTSWEKG